MQIIKLAIISFLVLFGILTLISLFIPSTIRMSKVINVKAERDSVFYLIKNKEQWARWNPIFMPANDPDHKQLQQTSFSIVSENDSSLVMQLQQNNKKPLVTGWVLHNISSADSSTLEWYINFHLPWYPWKKFSSLFYENTYGSMMEKGLYFIKQELEKEDNP